MFQLNISTHKNFTTIEISGDVVINYISELKQQIPEPTSNTLFKLENIQQYDFSFFQFLYYYTKILENHSLKSQIFATEKFKKDFLIVYPDIINNIEVTNE